MNTLATAAEPRTRVSLAPGERKRLAAMFGVLRPGGVAVLTTEMVLNAWGRHGDYFRRAELLDDLILPDDDLLDLEQETLHRRVGTGAGGVQRSQR